LLRRPHHLLFLFLVWTYLHMPGVGSRIHLELYWQKVYVTCDRGHLISCSLHNIVYINLRLITSRCLQRVWFLINSMWYYVFYTCTFFEICSRNLMINILSLTCLKIYNLASANLPEGLFLLSGTWHNFKSCCILQKIWLLNCHFFLL
jgi:hypothetical protein